MNILPDILEIVFLLGLVPVLQGSIVGYCVFVGSGKKSYGFAAGMTVFSIVSAIIASGNRLK